MRVKTSAIEQTINLAKEYAETAAKTPANESALYDHLKTFNLEEVRDLFTLMHMGRDRVSPAEEKKPKSFGEARLYYSNVALNWDDKDDLALEMAARRPLAKYLSDGLSCVGAKA